MHNGQPYYPGGQPRHRFRFYLVMTTIVVGIILFLLVMNDKEGFLNLTTSAVKTNLNNPMGNADTQTTNENPDSTTASSLREVDIQLSFDEVPKIKKDAKIQDLEVTFDDTDSKITLNGDKLELSGQETSMLSINGFSGKLTLSELGLSLIGNAKRIKVNGVTISSKGIDLSFSGLNYNSLTIDDIEIKEGVELGVGDGILKVGDKLTYTLEQDYLKMAYFNGKIVVDKSGPTEVSLEGVAKGIDVSGSILNMNLK